jgi:hypothetical protein
VVLPVGIEPTTSPLPRECSTTELRQHSGSEIGSRRDRKAIHEVLAAVQVRQLMVVSWSNLENCEINIYMG